MAKFICEKCNKEYEINSFSLGYKDGKSRYLDKQTKKEICCEDCPNEPLTYKSENFEGFGATYQKFHSLTPREKQKALKLRSHLDNKKIHAEIKEKDYYNGHKK